jgi:hypothetical protein
VKKSDEHVQRTEALISSQVEKYIFSVGRPEQTDAIVAVLSAI